MAPFTPIHRKFRISKRMFLNRIGTNVVFPYFGVGHFLGGCTNFWFLGWILSIYSCINKALEGLDGRGHTVKLWFQINWLTAAFYLLKVSVLDLEVLKAGPAFNSCCLCVALFSLHYCKQNYVRFVLILFFVYQYVGKLYRLVVEDILMLALDWFTLLHVCEQAWVILVDLI